MLADGVIPRKPHHGANLARWHDPANGRAGHVGYLGAEGLILTCLIGIAGALLGGWAATKIFHVHSLHGYFNASTWLTAIAGAAVLLLAYHLATRGSGGSRSGRSRSGSGRRYARR